MKTYQKITLVLLFILSISVLFYTGCIKQSINKESEILKSKIRTTGFSIPQESKSVTIEAITAYSANFIETNPNRFASFYNISNISLNSMFSSTGCATIGIYHGLFNSGNYNETNKCIIIIPINNQYKTMENQYCMINGILSSWTSAKNLINNYKNYTGLKDPVRGILLSIQEFNTFKNSVFPLRLYNLIDYQGDRRLALCKSFHDSNYISFNPGIINNSGKITNAYRWCPNICDIL